MKHAGWVFGVLGVVLLGALFVWFRPEAAAPPAPGLAAESARPAPSPAVHEFALTVRKGALAAGPDTLRVQQGDEVVIRIDADAPDEIHLHGYDLHAHVKPGQAAELRFVADRSGRFEYELHKAHVDLGALEVQPR